MYVRHIRIYLYLSNFWDLPAHRGVAAGVQFGARHGKPLATGCQSRVGPGTSHSILFASSEFSWPGSIHRHTCNLVALGV